MTEVSEQKMKLRTEFYHETGLKLINNIPSYADWLEKKLANNVLADGFPTHSVDITGKHICLGDKVTYDFDNNTSSFIVVFENNAFRKNYPHWDKTLEKPILEHGVMAKKMRFKIVHSATEFRTKV